MSKPSDWLDAARSVPLLDVAAALGLDVATKYGGASFGPCPRCGESTRGKGDSRGRCVVLDRDHKVGRWACHSNESDGCGAWGDAVALVVWTLTGAAWAKGDKAASATVRQWYADRGWCEPWATGGPRSTVAPARPRIAPVARPAAALPQRLPVDEVRDLWRRCVPVTADPAVSAYLAGRHDGAIDPAMVAALDLARALPADLRDLPRWARFKGQPWTESGHRLIVRCWEADADNAGRLRVAGLHARNVLPGCDPSDKAAWPAGASAAGLLFATGPDPTAHGLPLVELAEGVPDWLRLALTRAALPKGNRPAVWGVVNGSADPAVAAAVPEGWPVAIRTHADDSGDKYAEQWRQLLAARGCYLQRQRKANVAAAPAQPGKPDLRPVAAVELVNVDEVAWYWRWARFNKADAPAELATMWHYTVRDLGGPEGVPAEVARAHAQTVDSLTAEIRNEYHAILREVRAV